MKGTREEGFCICIWEKEKRYEYENLKQGHLTPRMRCPIYSTYSISLKITVPELHRMLCSYLQPESDHTISVRPEAYRSDPVPSTLLLP